MDWEATGLNAHSGAHIFKNIHNYGIRQRNVHSGTKCHTMDVRRRAVLSAEAISTHTHSCVYADNFANRIT